MAMSMLPNCSPITNLAIAARNSSSTQVGAEKNYPFV
jgi:hypothetical protein